MKFNRILLYVLIINGCTAIKPSIPFDLQNVKATNINSFNIINEINQGEHVNE